MKHLQQREQGATAVEYALMVSFIAVAIALTVGLFGAQVNSLLASIPPAIFS